MKNLLDWTDFHSWEPTIIEIMSDVITDDVINAFRSDVPEFLTEDDLEWLDNLIYRQSGQSVNSKYLLSDRLVEKYSHIRAYHGARPENIDSYYKNGIIALSPDQVIRKIKDIFLNQRFSSINEMMIENAIERVGFELRMGRVYFEANKKFLAKRCAHYMLYGSEFITAVAANIDENVDYKYVLKETGTPVIFECHVPLVYLDGATLLGFSGSALKYIFLSKIQDENLPSSIESSPAAFKIETDLNPEFVVAHSVPDQLFDPFLQEMVRIAL